MIQAYTALMVWLETSGYALCGPIRELYLHQAKPPDVHVTEIQLPLTRR
jgi:effector-binding domain-containing protein